MIVFYFLLVGIILVPVLIILPALRNKRQIATTDRDTENINIARQRMREIAKLKDDEENHFQEAQHELQATLLEDLRTDGKATEPPDSPTATVAFKSWGVLIILLIPLLSLTLYSYLGNPQFVVPTIGTAASNKQSDNQFDIAQLLALLEAKLAQSPNNAEGWELAATTYMKLGDYEKATSAYEKLNTLVFGNADFLVAWADAEILAAGNVYTPAAKDRIEKALSINPHHVNGLWIASLGSNSLGEYANARVYLNTLLPLVANDQESTADIERLIEDISIKADSSLYADNTRQQTSTANGMTNGKVIRVEVMLADSLITQADKNDVVFVFAKALEGPTIPLAVSMHRVKDLPIKIALTENMAMLPNITIASFDKITVTARVSKTGVATQQSGDLVSHHALVTAETRDNTVKLIIDQIVK